MVMNASSYFCTGAQETLCVLGYKRKASSSAASGSKAQKRAKTPGSSKVTGDVVDLADDADYPNRELCEALEELAGYEFKRNEKFKAIGLRKAAASLKEYGKQVKTGKEAAKLKGIGKSTASKVRYLLPSPSCHASCAPNLCVPQIDQCLKTGSIEILDQYRSEM